MAGINILGVRLGTGVLKVFTATKVLALGGVVILAFVFGRGDWGNLDPLWFEGSGSLSAVAIALALVSIIWTYEGWSDGPTLAGEVRDRDRDVVRALLLGTTAVVVIYLLANLAYLYVLGVDGVRATDAVAGEMAKAVFGPKGDTFVTILVLVSTLGSIMGMVIGSSRVFFAMGRERLFFSWVASVHPRWGTPAASLVVVGIVSAAYTLLGSFEEIIKYFVFVSTIWVALAIAAVIRLRVQRPEAKRPFRVPLYPLPPLIYLLVAGGLLYQLLRENTRDSLMGLGVVVASLPAFLLWERFRLRRESRPTTD
jgi:amino acid transporter